MREQSAGWLDMARSSLEAAELLRREGFAREAISRAYYAMFYAAKALTVEEGKDLSKHSAVIAAFGHDFVASSKFPAKLHQHLRDVFDDRTDADYHVMYEASEENAAEDIAYAREFVSAVEEYLKQTR